MENLFLPLTILGIGTVVALTSYKLLKLSGDSKNHEGHKRPQQQKIGISLDAWQGVKFGFGLGIGLILATGIFWILMASVIIASLKNFLATFVGI